jgi:hypothetical protein
MRVGWLLVLVALVLTACGRGEPEALDARQVAERAADALEAAEHLHFTIERSGFLAPTALALRQAEGDVLMPDRIRALVQASTFGIVSEIGVVVIGDQQWMTNPLSGRWEALAPGEAPLNLRMLFDPDQGVQGLLRRGEWTQAATESGQYVLRATFQGEQLAAMTSGLVAGGAVEVETRINADDFMLTEARLVERDSSPEDPTTWLIRLTRPGTPVEIAPPPVQ